MEAHRGVKIIKSKANLQFLIFSSILTSQSNFLADFKSIMFSSISSKSLELTLMKVSRFWKVRDASVRTHEHISWMQGALCESPSRFTQVNATERCFGQMVWRHECETINSNLMDAVDCLKHPRHPLE